MRMNNSENIEENMGCLAPVRKIIRVVIKWSPCGQFEVVLHNWGIFVLFFFRPSATQRDSGHTGFNVNDIFFTLTSLLVHWCTSLYKHPLIMFSDYCPWPNNNMWQNTNVCFEVEASSAAVTNITDVRILSKPFLVYTFVKLLTHNI